MNVDAGAARQTVSYVFDAAARGRATASGAGVATFSAASNSPSIAQPDASAPSAHDVVPASSFNGEDARQNLLDFLQHPDTAHLKMMRVSLHTVTYGATRQQSAPKLPVVTPPIDASIPIHVGMRSADDSVGIGVGNPVISYMMLRSAIHGRRAAGQTIKLIEGLDNTPIDPDQYLETLRQTAIAAVEAQGTVDKTA